MFYVYVLINASIVAYTDYIVFEGAKKYGSGVLTRISSLFVLSSFVIWFLVNPKDLVFFVDNPDTALMVSVLLLAVAYFSSRMKECDVSWAALKYTLPTVILAGFVGVFGKMAMDSAPLGSGPVIYGLLSSLLASVFALGRQKVIIKEPLTDLLSKKAIMVGAVAAILSVFYGLGKGVAYDLSSNPGYVDAVKKMSVLWVPLIYFMVGHKDNSKIWPGLAIAACVAALILIIPR